MTTRIERLSVATVDAWRALFDASHSGCFCRYWHFEGDKNAWLARSAFEPERNFQEHAQLVSNEEHEGRGLVALEGDACVGWLKLTPRASVQKLVRLGVYKRWPLGDDDGVWSIGCVLVRPDRRGQGVSRALIAAAAEHARRWGAKALEAYPHVQQGRVADEQLMRGALSAYLAEGFVEVTGERPYPVLRKSV